MPQNTYNKATTPAGPDAWNLTPDLKKMLETSNIPVPVSSQAERDGLNPPGGKYPGLTVMRLDIAGKPLEVYNGSSWDRHIAPLVRSMSPHIGTNIPSDAFLNGTLRPIEQFESVIVETSSIGNFTVTFPAPFPNAVGPVVAIHGDNTAFADAAKYNVTLGPVTLSGFTGNLNANGVSASLKTTRIEYIAKGW